MKFKKIDIDSRDVIIKYLNKENRRSCAYCFTDIFYDVFFVVHL